MEDDGTDEQAVSGVDIVIDNRLVEQVAVDKKSYKKYIKLYIAGLVKRVQAERPADVTTFKASAQKAVKKILDNFDDWQFFHGESDFDFDAEEKADGMLALMGWRDEGPYMLFFKDGLVEEKMVRFHVLPSHFVY